MDTHFLGIWGSVIGETNASPAGHSGFPGLEYCLVGTSTSSGSVTDLT